MVDNFLIHSFQPAEILSHCPESLRDCFLYNYPVINSIGLPKTITLNIVSSAFSVFTSLCLQTTVFNWSMVCNFTIFLCVHYFGRRWSSIDHCTLTFCFVCMLFLNAIDFLPSQIFQVQLYQRATFLVQSYRENATVLSQNDRSALQQKGGRLRLHVYLRIPLLLDNHFWLPVFRAKRKWNWFIRSPLPSSLSNSLCFVDGNGW